MMEWWYQSAEERMSAPTVYPPPPPPPAPKVRKEFFMEAPIFFIWSIELWCFNDRDDGKYIMSCC